MFLTDEQYDQLLRPIAASRIAQRSQSGVTLSYLEAWDVKAHLIRIFGFGNWSADVLSAELMFEEKDEKGRWNVGYKVIMRLTIYGASVDDPDATYTEAAVGSATLGNRGEAHDMAVKTAESDALKRAAINLGTQFGLSLYDNGNRNDVIKRTLNPPIGYGQGAPPPDTTPNPALMQMLEAWVAESEVCDDRNDLKQIWDTADEAGQLDTPVTANGAGTTLRNVILNRLDEIDNANE